MRKLMVNSWNLAKCFSLIVLKNTWYIIECFLWVCLFCIPIIGQIIMILLIVKWFGNSLGKSISQGMIEGQKRGAN